MTHKQIGSGNLFAKPKNKVHPERTSRQTAWSEAGPSALMTPSPQQSNSNTRSSSASVRTQLGMPRPINEGEILINFIPSTRVSSSRQSSRQSRPSRPSRGSSNTVGGTTFHDLDDAILTHIIGQSKQRSHAFANLGKAIHNKHFIEQAALLSKAKVNVVCKMVEELIPMLLIDELAYGIDYYCSFDMIQTGLHLNEEEVTAVLSHFNPELENFRIVNFNYINNVVPRKLVIDPSVTHYHSWDNRATNKVSASVSFYDKKGNVFLHEHAARAISDTDDNPTYKPHLLALYILMPFMNPSTNQLPLFTLKKRVGGYDIDDLNDIVHFDNLNDLNELNEEFVAYNTNTQFTDTLKTLISDVVVAEGAGPSRRNSTSSRQ